LLKGHKERLENRAAGAEPLGAKHDPPLQRKDHTAASLVDQPPFEDPDQKRSKEIRRTKDKTRLTRGG